MTSATSSPIVGNLVGNLLAVDTSTASGSIAIAKFQEGQGPQILSESHWNKLAMHSEVATLEVTKALDAANLTLADITHFAVNIGPGSFTGLRVGINLVRTLAYALDKPVAMFSSLEVLAFDHVVGDQEIMIAIKAIQNFYYAAAFAAEPQGLRTIVEPFSGTMEEISAKGSFARTIVLGNSAEPLNTTARTLVAMSNTASFSSWNSVKPLYVRGSEAEEKLKKGLLKPLP